MSECLAGKCIAGRIGANEFTEDDWERAKNAHEIAVDDFNTRGKRQQVNHPGFLRKASYCTNCGRKL